MRQSTRALPVPVIMGASVWVLWVVAAVAGAATGLVVALIWGGWR